jgi:hypothetical protein
MLTTWTLILTIVAHDYRGGSAVTSVPGLASQEVCEATAKAWTKVVAQQPYSQGFTVCVPAKQARELEK